MNHALDLPRDPEGLINRLWVTHIPLQQMQGGLSCQLLDPLQRFRTAVAEIVEHHQLVALLKQDEAGVASNETSPSSDQQAAGHGAFPFNGQILEQPLRSPALSGLASTVR